MLSKSAAIVRKEVGCQAPWPLRVQSVPRLSATTPGSTPGMSQDELMPIKTKAPDIKSSGLWFEWERGHLLSPQHTHPSLPPLRTHISLSLPSGHHILLSLQDTLIPPPSRRAHTSLTLAPPRTDTGLSSTKTSLFPLGREA